jgi:hypothetical protein
VGVISAAFIRTMKELREVSQQYDRLKRVDG